MSPTWYGTAPPPGMAPVGPLGWLRVAGKGGALAIVVFGGLALLLVLRLLEAPLFRPARPWTPGITVAVCRAALWIIGLRRRIEGRPAGDAVVANHVSWLDIFALNACARLTFVAKAEVAGWPGVGWLARATGTLFVRRDRRDAGRQRTALSARLRAGDRLTLFPEGTSSDGLRVLPFKPTLFAALADAGVAIQPVSLIYTAPVGADPRFYGWWGDMEFGAHLLAVLAAPRQGEVRVVFHPPIPPGPMADRKTLARAAEAAVRAPFDEP